MRRSTCPQSKITSDDVLTFRCDPVIRQFAGGLNIALDNHSGGMLGISDPDFSESRGPR